MPLQSSSAERLAASIPDGARLAIPKTAAGVSMAVTRELVHRAARDLHLIGIPTSGLQADILIGAGCVSLIETSAVSLGEFGTGPRFAAAVRTGAVKVLDATCPAIYAALQAGVKGIPFIPLRGLIGTDVLTQRADWKVIDNPFGQDDPIVLLPAIRPDVALFHAARADRSGNVYVGRERELMMMAQAALRTLVTVEEIVDEDLMADDSSAAATIAALYVDEIAVAPRGAWPLAFLDRYALDARALGEYAALARTEAGFRSFLDSWLGNEKGRAA
ncbi:MAG: CoA synthetase [Burkholderiales bacterium]|nr:CoA synthetase [Burkholderiales bacterium]